MRPPRLFHRPCTSQHGGGFTLVELLVAVGLTSVMLWGILQLFSSATRFSSTVTAEAEVCSAVRAVLERITREISTAATLNAGYIKITNSGGRDSIQFVAPILDRTSREVEIEHVKFDTDGDGNLRRSTKAPAVGSLLNDVPGSYTDAATFGLRVERFNIEYIKTNGSKGTTYDKLTEMPAAILVEVVVVDTKRRVTFTMTSSAPMLASGI